MGTTATEFHTPGNTVTGDPGRLQGHCWKFAVRVAGPRAAHITAREQGRADDRGPGCGPWHVSEHTGEQHRTFPVPEFKPYVCSICVISWNKQRQEEPGSDCFFVFVEGRRCRFPGASHACEEGQVCVARPWHRFTLNNTFWGARRSWTCCCLNREGRGEEG